MKIEQIAGLSTPQTHGAKAEAQVSARERAIRMIQEQTTQVPKTPETGNNTPVKNPTQVGPEELGAIKASTKTQELPQNNIDREAKAESSEAAPTEDTSKETLSSQYAALARKEKALRQRDQALRAREDALRAKEAPVTAEKPSTPSIDLTKFIDKERLAQDPFTVLSEMGLDYDKLTELALNAPKPEQIALNNEIRALKAEIAALKGETENTRKSIEDGQKQQYTQAMNQIRNEVKSLVNLDPQFEMIKATGSVGDVVELIEKTFNEDGVLMTVEDAALKVEEYLAEEALKLSKLKKIQQKLAPKVTTTSAPKPASQTEQPQLKTLTNSVSSSRPLTAKERAILAFENKLKNTNG